MSQEQPPARSRRELRQARAERQDAPSGAGTSSSSGRPEEQTEAEITGRRRIPGPVDSVRTTSNSQRSSQIRARDRATLRTIKELAEKEGQLSPGGMPTRRQLRLQQLAEETAPGTSANPIIPVPSPRTRSNTVVAPAQHSVAHDSAAQSGAAQDNAAPGAGPGGKLPGGMSVEQALAARELLAEQARNQAAKLEHIAATDPDAVDPDVLAEQIALAERAAVLNRRATAKQKLAEQNNQPSQRDEQPRPEPQKSGPSTASNLAMVTPLEFVQVPGIQRPVMKRPATSYVPLVTNPGPKLQPPRTSRRPASSRQPAGGPDNGRAGVLARAEAAAAQAAAAQAAGRRPAAASGAAAAGTDEESAARPPVPAHAAYGLEPLDAATAGLGRAQRLRILQFGILILGLLALITGIVLIITGTAR